MSEWFCIKTAPQKEFAVASILRTYGYDVVCPTEVKFRKDRRSKKRTMVEYPMFSRYLFISRDGGVPWWHLDLKVRDYSGAVSVDGRSPTPVLASEVKRIRSMGRHPGTSVNLHRALEVGNLAYVADGSYTGKLVKIEGIEQGYALFLGKMFGVDRMLKVRLSSLEAA